MNSKATDLGLTEKEYGVLKKLGECQELFCKLKRQHPSEKAEFIYAVHLIQDLMVIRVIRRAYPKGWSTYEVKKEEEQEDRNLNLHNNIIYNLNKELEEINKKLEKIINDSKEIKIPSGFPYFDK